MQHVYAAAVEHHQAGRLTEAERLYRQILAQYPSHPDTLHLLGLAMFQGGQTEPGIAAIRQAIAANPSAAPYHANLGHALRQLGRLGEAVAAYRQLLTLQPREAAAHAAIGAMCLDLGRRADAETSLRQAIALDPALPMPHRNLGVLHRLRGDTAAAEACFRQAIARAPDLPLPHFDLGGLLLDLGRAAEAEACYRQALAIQPAFPEAHNNLGNALKHLGRTAEAIASYRAAIAVRPDYAEAHNNLGALFLDLGQAEDAAASCRAALRVQPQFPAALFNLAAALLEQRALDDAAAAAQSALDLNPGIAEAHNILGTIRKEQGSLAQAEACYRSALSARPDYPEALGNLANIFLEQGRLEDAIAGYERALTVRPGDFPVFSNMLFAQNYAQNREIGPLADAARRFGALAAAAASAPFSDWPPHDPSGPLRVGLVSGDFRNHPVGYFLEGLLRATDPARVTFAAFPTRPGEDELTARIRPFLAGWHPIHGLNDRDAAALIHDSRISVLLDLAGHTSGNRLPVFAWRPAPVQAAWLGYFATTGLREMDFIMGDPQVTPAAEAHHFTETIWPLPETYLCFTPPADPVPVSPLPAIENGHVTFGCFNNVTKLNDGVVSVWARVLDAVTGSRLMLKARQLADGAVADMLRKRFDVHGVGADRLILEPPSSRADYFRAYHRIDIALDPFPYPGGTTTCEALFMGIPILTRRGDRFLSHAGETFARNAGLADWIATDDGDYVARAVRLAADVDGLAALRAGLRDRVLASPLCDADRFARHFADAVWGMWRARG